MIKRTPIGYPVHLGWGEFGFFTGRGRSQHAYDEVCCPKGLRRGGWELPPKGQGVVLCFSDRWVKGANKVVLSGCDVDGERMKLRLQRKAKAEGDILSIRWRAVHDFERGRLPAVVVRLLTKHKSFQDKTIYWWPEYVEV